MENVRCNCLLRSNAFLLHHLGDLSILPCLMFRSWLVNVLGLIKNSNLMRIKII